MSQENRKSIYCDDKTFKKLERIAEKNNRTIIGQIRHWIEGEIK